MRGVKAGLLMAAVLAVAPAYAQQRIAPETWLTAADYPPVAGDGMIGLNFAITPEGRVAACTIRYTTVPKQLAETACARLVERARYTPAFDTTGKPVDGRDAITVSWRAGLISFPGMSDDFGGAVPANNPQLWATNDDYPRGMPKSELLDVPMKFKIGADGRIASCQAPDGFSHPAIAAHTCRLMVRRARFDMPRDKQGNPMPTQGRTNFYWRGPNAKIAK